MPCLSPAHRSRRACSNTDEAFQAALHQAVALQFGGGGAAEGGEGDGTAVGEVEWAVESIERSQEGLVLFEGGTFSAGPTSLGERGLGGQAGVGGCILSCLLACCSCCCCC